MNQHAGTIYQAAPYKPENSLYEIRLEMWRRGDKFVQSLCRLMADADLENQAIIINAWPKIIERYDGFATVTKREQAELIQREQEDAE